MLEELKSAYMNGQLEKSKYISEMYKVHDVLWDYKNLIADSDVKKIEIMEEGVFFTIDNGIVFDVPRGDERVVPVEMLNMGGYEKEDWMTMIDLLIAAKVKNILDIGANIGYISLLLSKRLEYDNIICFEPIKKTYDYLCRNIALNDAKVKTENIGLSNEKGQMTYYYYPEGSGNASLRNLSQRDSVEEVKADVDTLDNYILEHNIKNIDFMKIDVEGSEFLVLKGGKNLICDSKPIIYVELLRKWSAPFNYRPNDVLQWLGNMGYVSYAMSDQGLKRIEVIDEDTVETNFVFLHEIKHEKLIEGIDS